MRVISAYELQKRIVTVASQMDCQNNELAKQGKASPEIDRQIFELMFIHQFLPFFSVDQIRQKECYLNETYGV